MLVHIAKDLKMRKASVSSFLRPALDIAVNFESESVTSRIIQGHVFWGEDMDHAEAVSRLVQPGQVVLTNAIWQDINHTPFRGLQVTNPPIPYLPLKRIRSHITTLETRTFDDHN
jgi:hypothetical protein